MHSPALKWFLKVCISLPALFALWLLGGTNWYLMFMVFTVRFKVVDALLSMKWKPGWIRRIFKSSDKDLKSHIVSLLILFFIAVVRMALQSYKHITYMYPPPPALSGGETSTYI